MTYIPAASATAQDVCLPTPPPLGYAHTYDRAAADARSILLIFDGPCDDVPEAIRTLLRDAYAEIVREARDELRTD